MNKFECQFTVTLYWTPILFTSSGRIKIRKWGGGVAKHSHSICVCGWKLHNIDPSDIVQSITTVLIQSTGFIKV